MSTHKDKHTHIIIVGGGFGGVRTAHELAKNPRFLITVISDRQEFQYYPALYSTATGHSHKESWVPLQSVFAEHPTINLVHDTITSVDPVAKTVSGTHTYSYDKVVFALGSITTYFGIDGLDTYAYGIKSQAEIYALQQHLIDEMSDGKDDEKNYVIIGAGPTGVELAGAIGEYLRTLRKLYKIRKKTLHISLIEAAPRVLPRMSEHASARAHARLKKLGVNVELNKKVEKQTAGSLVVNGKPLPTHTVIWTSGVATASFYSKNGSHFTLTSRRKVGVDAYLRANEDIYVIGDNADTPYSGLAQTALHDAVFVAKHIQGRQTKAYKPVMPASVVPIGRSWALFEWKKIRFYGKPAAVVRSLADIIGYHDVLPIGYAVKAWRAQQKKQLRIPAPTDTSSK